MKSIGELAKDRLVKIAEAADLLGVSVRTVWRMIADGVLEAVRVGRRSVRLRLSDVEAYMHRSSGSHSQGRT